MFVEDKKDGELVCLTQRTWRDTLNDAADLLERQGWCQGMYYGAHQGQLAHCALGAIWAVEGWDHRNIASANVGPSQVNPRAKQAAAHLYVALGESIPHWNDRVVSDAKTVIATLRSVACS